MRQPTEREKQIGKLKEIVSKGIEIRRLYTDENVLIKYSSKIKLYSCGKIEIRKYDRAISKKNNDYENILADSKPIKSKVKKLKSKIRTDNLSRARNNIIDLVTENSEIWKSFITLTFEENIKSLKDANKTYNVWKTQVLRRFSDFKCLAVPEFQKRGAVHYHMLTNIQCGSDLIPKRLPKKLFNSETKKYKELDYYNLVYWNYGFSSAYDLAQADENFDPVKYILKYLYKDMDNRLYGHKKFLISGKLRKPEVEYLENEEKFNRIIDYLKTKQYEINGYEIPIYEPYQIPTIIYNFELLKEDFSTICRILDNEVNKQPKDKLLTFVIK